MSRPRTRLLARREEPWPDSEGEEYVPSEQDDIEEELPKEKEEEQEEQEQEEVGDAEASDNKKKTRSSNWQWQDEYLLIKLVHKNGKNFDKILKHFHDKHRLVHIRDKDKLRVHFNTLNAKRSKLRKPFKPKKFKPPSGCTKEEIRRLEACHANTMERERQQREKASQMLREIEGRELLTSTEKRVSAEEAQANITARQNERRAIRDHRLQEAERDALEERQFRISLSQALTQLTAFVPVCMATQNALLEYLQLRILCLKREERVPGQQTQSQQSQPQQSQESQPQQPQEEVQGRKRARV
jgi:hypothetical protein